MAIWVFERWGGVSLALAVADQKLLLEKSPG